MCEKQETSGEWCVSIGRESVEWKGGKVSDKVSHSKVSKCVYSNTFSYEMVQTVAICQNTATNQWTG
jgi:hypothetical protein